MNSNSIPLDIIGTGFYSVSDVFKRKFLTLHSHFKFDHHPLRRLLEEFKRWLQSFISEKQGKIKDMAMLYDDKNDEQDVLWREHEKLVHAIKEQVVEFVNIFARATILFYQLDVKKGEITMLCLQNLITSLTLKNPLYTKVIEVFRAALKPKITSLESGLESLSDKRLWVQRQLHLTEWEIGRRIKQLQDE